MSNIIRQIATALVVLAVIGGCTYLLIDDSIKNPTTTVIETVGVVTKISVISNINFWGVTTTYTLQLNNEQVLVLDEWSGPIKTGDTIKLERRYRGKDFDHASIKYFIVEE